ncbi:MAG: sigma-70 family RNA polymerase sigma factor [Verrucomicrobiota bacterium]
MTASQTQTSDLMERCQQGDEVAWRQLILERQEQVTRWISRCAYWASVEDLEDLRQEVFLKIIKSARHYERKYANVDTWLFQQTRSRVYDDIRHRTAAKRLKDEWLVSRDATVDEDGVPLEHPDERLLPSEEAARNEDAARLRRALMELDEPCRTIVELRFFGGFEYEEIATNLKLHAKTVSSRLCRCLDKLRLMKNSLETGSNS